MRIYMNPETGSVGGYDDWFYTTESGQLLNAVDLKEVIEVVKDSSSNWIEKD